METGVSITDVEVNMRNCYQLVISHRQGHDSLGVHMKRIADTLEQFILLPEFRESLTQMKWNILQADNDSQFLQFTNDMDFWPRPPESCVSLDEINMRLKQLEGFICKDTDCIKRNISLLFDILSQVLGVDPLLTKIHELQNRLIEVQELNREMDEQVRSMQHSMLFMTAQFNYLKDGYMPGAISPQDHISRLEALNAEKALYWDRMQYSITHKGLQRLFSNPEKTYRQRLEDVARSLDMHPRVDDPDVSIKRAIELRCEPRQTLGIVRSSRYWAIRDFMSSLK